MKSIKLLIIISLSIYVILIALEAWCVYFAGDTLYLFENGKRITDNSIIVTHDIYKKVCIKGIYVLGQQFSRNLIFYNTNKSELEDYREWQEGSYLMDKNCRGYITQKSEWEKAKKQFEEENKDYYIEIQKRVGIAKTREERRKIWDEWIIKKDEFMHAKGFTFFRNSECYKYGTKAYDAYLQSCMNSAAYQIEIAIPEPIDQETHDAPPLPRLGGRIGTSRCFNVDIKTGKVEQIGCSKSDPR
ncbi:MAG: hypothetical protein AB1629_06775 [Candidatus Omnitrophota bacterium]